jgi:hypothetical protein
LADLWQPEVILWNSMMRPRVTPRSLRARRRSVANRPTFYPIDFSLFPDGLAQIDLVRTGERAAGSVLAARGGQKPSSRVPASGTVDSIFAFISSKRSAPWL